MSFGGGNSQYTLEYIVKVVNQGGTAGLNQINTGLQQVQGSTVNVTHAMDKMKAANEKVVQAGQGITKAAKGMAFGFLGLTTAGAEFFGMMSMWKATQQGVKEAQDKANKALAEGGKNSSEYKDAMQDVAKANRWAQMTFRNLMLSAFDLVPFFVLSVNGIVKLRNAYKALREAQLEQKAMKEVLAAAGIKEAAAANLQNASYASLTATQRRLKAEQALGITTMNAKTAAMNVGTASNLSHNGSLITQIPLLGKQATAMNATSAATTRLSKAMRVLSIAMKVAIPLVIIEIASQAFQNNWGGFADKVNAVGKAFGDAVPFMRGFLDIIGKIGRSIAAIFTGNFEDVKGIWEGVSEAQKENTEITEDQQKAIDELAQSLRDISSANFDFLADIGDMKKGDRRDALEAMGFSGNTAKKIAGLTKDLFKMHDIFDNFKNSIETMKTLNILQKFGFDIPNKTWKNLGKGLSKQFKELSKEFPGVEMFEEFASVMEKASKEKGPVMYKAIMTFAKENPDFMPFLKELRPDLYAALETLGKESAGGLSAGISAGLSHGLEVSNSNAMMGDYQIDENGFLRKKKDGGDKKGGMLDNFVEGLKTAVKGLPAQIKAIDWTAVGAGIREGLLSIFTLKNATALGNLIRANIIDPVFAAMGEALRPAIEEFKKDPIGFTIGVIDAATGWIGALVAGIFGYNSEPEMFNDVDAKINKILGDNPYISSLRSLVQDPIGSLINLLTGHSIAGLESVDISKHSVGPDVKKALGIPGGGYFDELMDSIGVNKFFDAVGEVWREIERLVNGVGAGIAEFLSDPIGWFINKVKKQSEGPNGPQKIDPNTGNKIPGQIPGLIPPGTSQYKPAVFTIGGGDGQGELNMAQQAARMHDAVIIVFQDMVTKINQQFQHLAQVWSVVMNSLGINAESGSTQVQEHITNMWTFVVGVFDSLASHWSSINNSFGANAKSGADQIYKALRKTFDKVINDMSALASHWSSMCNSLINNAKAAAKGINKALDSIEDEEVVIRYRVVGSPMAKGGLMSFAGGGIMSAAGGRLLTTNGAQLFQIGDNPGGRESIWAVPHDNPGPTLAKIDRMYGRMRGGNGSSSFNGNFTFVIPGNDIINPVKLNKRIKSTVGNDMDRYGA